MPDSMTREIALLQKLAEHLERRPLPFEALTQQLLRSEGLGRVREKAGGIIAVRMPGQAAFIELVDRVLDRLPALDRGAIYANVQSEVFTFIEAYVGRDPSAIGIMDAEAIVSHLDAWFAAKASSRRVFVPCLISRTTALRFEIGPVTFEFVDRLTGSDFYPAGGGDAALDRSGFDDLLKWMREQEADWLARVSVDGCEQKRAEEIAELAVDLVIVAFQMAAPHMHTREMSRLDARRGSSQKRTLSEADGYHSAGWARKEPGLTIGRGTLNDILLRAAPLFTAVGNIVNSFASGAFRLPVLERAWCDSAYWLHQALAESLDTIAIAKLETALEVLVRSESSRGSGRRILEILGAFFDLGPDDPVAPGSLTSARQFAQNIVRDRSRILHGTWSTLNARSIDRVGMEGFVITVLRTAAVELEKYARCAERTDGIDGFLGWVRKRGASAAPALGQK
jgi:hypothetical protein